MKATPVWFNSLTDSVFALGAAAREARRAARTAQLTREQYDPDRVRLLDAEVHVDGSTSGGAPFRPHDAAVFTIGDTLSKTATVLSALYTNTALAYAYGTAWAILRVLDGEQPAAVQLGRTRDGHYILPRELCPVPPVMPGLERWNDHTKFEQARRHLAECDAAGMHADLLDEQPELSDHEAAELHAALDVAAGFPDAAYTYGELAESAMHFALLGPKAQHARTRG
ncbi:hypothetical protein [Streptomyces purpurascens]|uniref:hypothetical protein n=1 Tax=Streptomyces purpurascens TaxID=1924 RepID=UPI0016746E55|nr:hypothetical protein [Streptomyces purpurascens]MCE7051310.1 hypothetical protein [Streptomyces purpurascens]GHA52775.1 hypothetical protein GCM10010303_75850 [Streptomyces purpurascens]